jgi:hypothetical protein
MLRHVPIFRAEAVAERNQGWEVGENEAVAERNQGWEVSENEVAGSAPPSPV